jgi:hypothetical protein
MGLQRLRDKLNAQAYRYANDCLDEEPCIFGRFDAYQGSVRSRMASALGCLLNARLCMALYPPNCWLGHSTPGTWDSQQSKLAMLQDISAKIAKGMPQRLDKVKALEAEYIADQEGRAAAAAAASIVATSPAELLRRVNHLERDRTQLTEGKALAELKKTQLSQLNGQFKEDKIRLRSQLIMYERLHIEDAHDIAQLQHQVQQKRGRAGWNAPGACKGDS